MSQCQYIKQGAFEANMQLTYSFHQGKTAEKANNQLI
jgi:hypothetical protein